MKILMKSFIVATVLAFSALVQANLIVNGSFEDNDVKSNSWKWFTSANVQGWDGSTIEIWDNYQNFRAYEGDQYAELNAHGNRGQAFSIFQNIQTIVGARYSVSFAYAARTNNNEQFSYTVGGNNAVIESIIISDHVVKKWKLFETSFVASSVNSQITFTSVRPSTATIGNFLDNVVVTMQPTISAANVSAPATLTFFFVGALGLLVLRRGRFKS